MEWFINEDTHLIWDEPPSTVGIKKKKKVMKCFPNMVKFITIGRLWNENISWHINKQTMLQPSAISVLQMWMRAPQTAIRKILPPSSQHWLLRNWKNARRKVNKRTRLAPDSWDAYEMNAFNEPRGVHLPIYWMLNSLTWYLIFDVQTACSFCCKLVYSLTSPPASLEQYSQSYWRLRVLNIPTK